jgi:hypothetical protein
MQLQRKEWKEDGGWIEKIGSCVSDDINDSRKLMHIGECISYILCLFRITIFNVNVLSVILVFIMHLQNVYMGGHLHFIL